MSEGARPPGPPPGPPEIDESWTNPPIPTSGEGLPALTVVVRGARRDRPLRAALGEAEGELPYLGQAVFALRLGGVPEAGRLQVAAAGGPRWEGDVAPGRAAGGEALILLEQQGARLQRLPGDPDPPAAPEAGPPVLHVLWLLLALGLGWRLR